MTNWRPMKIRRRRPKTARGGRRSLRSRSVAVNHHHCQRRGGFLSLSWTDQPFKPQRVAQLPLGRMELPPGPRYVLRLIPTFAVPSLAVYLTLTVLQLQGFCNLSLWFIVPAVLLAKPILFFWDIHYSKWATRRAAASLGAVVPPVVQEWSIFTIKEIAGTTRTGHPCASNLCLFPFFQKTKVKVLTL